MASTKDAPLLSLAQSNFDVLVTVDRNLERQFVRGEYRLGLVMVLNLPSTRIGYWLPLFGELLKAAEMVRPGEVIHVSGSASRRD